MAQGRRSLVGTRAAGDLCASCGHSAIRHEDYGTGRCGALVYTAREDAAGQAHGVTWTVCTCKRFHDRERLW